ncbi:GCS-domain-containing protein [Microthyrium microscopicum]|uniref:Glutamate--cysteine ligase n=1 Tax=Microthyrium microscopicum TaxID=703497 RepID=A0A6A6UEJ5_9PEZI|nr:GCS-domain-containing protein [Microthyrium microscopicum]
MLSRLPDSNVFQPEFARFMIETEPNKPYGNSPKALLKVKDDMKQRREAIQSELGKEEKLMTLSVFPRLGVDHFLEPDGQHPKVKDYDATVANGKYGYAMNNVTARARRAREIKIPIFQDKNTTGPKNLTLNHFIYGPGACSLQATFQCQTLDDARRLHDQLTVLAPIFLALTAATPVYRGILVDTDARINQISQAVDDRSPDEKARSRLSNRWSTSPMYLQRWNQDESHENNLDSELQKTREEHAAILEAGGMDSVLAKFFATIHLRDPIYLDCRDGNVENVTGKAVHLSLLSSFWSHVRLKVPEPDAPNHGWRVEFRPMELQPTDYENAAILVFLNLLRQTLSWLGPEYDFWMPLNLVEENMQRAHTRDGLTQTRFWFPSNSCATGNGSIAGSKHRDSQDITELSIADIINGRTGVIEGLLPTVRRFLASNATFEDPQSEQLEPYLNFIELHAEGKIPTTASWIRNFVQAHHSYKKDSRVGPEISYDMLCEWSRQT